MDLLKANHPAKSRETFNQIRLLRVLPNLTWTVSRYGASTSSLSNLFYRPHCKKLLPYIQPKLILFKTITPCSITTGSAKMFVPTFLIGPLQVLEDYWEVFPEPSLLHSEQAQFSQPFLIGDDLSSFLINDQR